MIGEKSPNLIGYKKEKMDEIEQEKGLEFFCLLSVDGGGRRSKSTTFFC